MIIGQPVSIRPLNGAVVKKPDGSNLSAGGEIVRGSPYWQRRVADGSVEVIGAGLIRNPPIGERAITLYGALADRPPAPEFGKKSCEIITDKIYIKCTSTQGWWFSDGYSDSVDDRPAAADLGIGNWRTADGSYSVSNGTIWGDGGITAIETAALLAANAKTAAEAARDAAIIGAGVYVDEPTGRAAVADGVAFKVQGSGDVAAYEYRRVNASSSTLIAIYPSANSQYIGKVMPLESGYVWAIVDTLGQAALMIDAAGAVHMPKFSVQSATELQALLPQSVIKDSGYAWAVVDSTGKIGLAITNEGKVIGDFPVAVVAGSEYLQPSKNLYFIGDSLTAGAGSQTTWRQALVALISARTHVTQAVGGETSTQQAAKFGAYVSLLTLTGNQIPASGGVAVTSRTIDVLSAQGTQTIVGSIAGIPGTLSRDGSGNYTFTRTTAGSVVNVGAKMPFIPDISTHDRDTLLIFIGRNNLGTPDDVKRDIASCVGKQTTIEKRFLILTPPNGGTLTSGQSTTEGTGSSTLTNIKAIEDWAVQTYGDRVIKIREFSFQFNNGSADDLADVAKETVPRSLRIDSVHFTTAFHAQIAAYVASEINRRGW